MTKDFCISLFSQFAFSFLNIVSDNVPYHIYGKAIVLHSQCLAVSKLHLYCRIRYLKTMMFAGSASDILNTSQLYFILYDLMHLLSCSPSAILINTLRVTWLGNASAILCTSRFYVWVSSFPTLPEAIGQSPVLSFLHKV